MVNGEAVGWVASACKSVGATMIHISTLPPPSSLATELVGEVRRHTKLSYDKSCLAVEVVLTHIANKMPQTAGLMEKILCTFQEVLVLGLSVNWT